MHTTDSDCAATLDHTDNCTACGAYHGDACPDCGGRAYHTAGCPTNADPCVTCNKPEDKCRDCKVRT
jgi:hypothetical protein